MRNRYLCSYFFWILFLCLFFFSFKSSDITDWPAFIQWETHTTHSRMNKKERNDKNDNITHNVSLDSRSFVAYTYFFENGSACHGNARETLLFLPSLFTLIIRILNHFHWRDQFQPGDFTAVYLNNNFSKCWLTAISRDNNQQQQIHIFLCSIVK